MIYRQGDVYFVKVDKQNKPYKEERDVILAEGEVTGHKHRIQNPSTVKMYNVNAVQTTDKANYFLRAFMQVGEDSTTVVHEEHEAITLPPGEYEVRIQQEYSPIGYRQVAD